MTGINFAHNIISNKNKNKNNKLPSSESSSVCFPLTPFNLFVNYSDGEYDNITDFQNEPFGLKRMFVWTIGFFFF
jgi:hypothetical protein